MNFSDRKYLPLFVLFSIVFISRLPFLSAGYGVEEDSWGIALAAFNTYTTGIYEPSRFPGHPVHEFIYSTFWGFQPFFYNLFSALYSAIASLFFALILKELKFKHFFIAALAFAFTMVAKTLSKMATMRCCSVRDGRGISINPKFFLLILTLYLLVIDLSALVQVIF